MYHYIQSKATPAQDKSMAFPNVQKVGQNNFSQIPRKECVTHAGPSYTVQEDHRFPFCFPTF